jgi:hypothetical protein
VGKSVDNRDETSKQILASAKAEIPLVDMGQLLSKKSRRRFP